MSFLDWDEDHMARFWASVAMDCEIRRNWADALWAWARNEP